MVMKVQSYLSFEGRTEEALDFYQRVLGAKVEQMMRYKDVAEAREHAPPGGADKVMHCAFKIGDTQLMASDGMNTGKPNFAGISLALTVRDDAEAKRVFDALSDGGQVQMPLTKTFFASSFGMLADRFGVTWMIVTEGMPA
jgi:PhnB protein